MLRVAAFCLISFCLVLSCVEVKKTHTFKPQPSAIPSLHITSDTSAVALKISGLDIQTVIASNIATTTFDLRFYNPNDKILEGEFEFPLADGQQIVRYALDMNGSLREGVVVEKAKARVAFESTVRQKIDPGLVEKTRGNNFRTRIYPLPAKGYRRIVIAIEQTLVQEDRDLLYQLPLYAKGSIDTFSINVSIIKSFGAPQLDENGMPLRFTKKQEKYIASRRENNFIANETLAFALPGSFDNSDVVLTENQGGQTYFYVNSRLEAEPKKKDQPTSLGILWDVSSSGEKRDLKKEMELLGKYVRGLGNIPVSLIPFNVRMQAKEDFTDAGKLLKRLESMVYDGGTQFGAVDLSNYNFDEILLFSDGLSTFGKQDIVLGKSPVTAINSSPSANYAYLKYIAQQSHGSFIDLGKLETATALQELHGHSLQIINIHYDESKVSELVTQTTPVLNTGLSFAGKLNAESALIKLELGFGNEVVMTKNYLVARKDGNDYDQVKRIWAGMTISRLDMEYEKNKEAITALGKKFSIVTQNTSLIVLDRIEDYVEHEIVPPVELQKEYYALLEKKQEDEKDEKDLAFDEALGAMKKLKNWWQKDHVKKIKPPKVDTVSGSSLADSVAVVTTAVPYMTITTTTEAGSMDSGRIILPNAGYYDIDTSAPSVTIADHLELDSSVGWGGGVGLTGRVSGVVALNCPTFSLYASPGTYAFTPGNGDSNGDGVADRFDAEMQSGAKTISDIQLNAWKPDATYLKTLEQTPVNQRFTQYLLLKNQYAAQPSFFADVARFFIEKNEKQIGVQVLSNISEMKLEDAELLRIVANQLLDMGEKELAVISFEQILKMREEDPQSYRDLALAYNETGEYNKAVQLLYDLVTGSWDERFGDVKAIALNEMNAIISAQKGFINTVNIDKRLIYPMPVDVRIVIGWNADNSDIDLWVTDPNKEKCAYDHTETEMGGRISDDVTMGYGPEEFLLKKAKKGNYVVDVNLYGDHRQTLGGPIAIRADLFTDFGKPTQKRKTINFRVTSAKEVINLGSLKFGS